MTKVVRELVDILGQQLIGVLDAVVDVGNLVEGDSIQVLVMCVLLLHHSIQERYEFIVPFESCF